MSGAGTEAMVLGVGNILMGDEGIGVAVVRELERFPESLPAGIRIVDGGTLGLDLLPLVASTDTLVIIDAIQLGSTPGTVAVLKDDEIDGRFSGHISIHQVGVADLLAAARLSDMLPERVSLVGIQPGAVEVGLELSSAVEAAIPQAIDAVRHELVGSAV